MERMLEQGGGLSISHIQLKTDYLPSQNESGLLPDMLFANDVQASDDGCYPFGEHFAPYGIFSLSCEEAFSKPGSEIRLRFRMKLLREQQRRVSKTRQEKTTLLFLKERCFYVEMTYSR